ncbi:MAG: TIGR02281 family clan AA aspartic protease [Alphaproteobacteria bacterium]|nr:TIGR02281 family clan AA aspartic protease [Alphaproteobacteria bacterium]
MSRVILVLLLLAVTAGVVAAARNPERAARLTDNVSELLRHGTSKAQAIAIPRGRGGAFALRAKINGVNAPMIVDTGATSVVLTYETAKAAGLPLEVLIYDIDIETAAGRSKAARLTLDRLAIGNMVQRSVPALVVPPGAMKTNLLGMSFLDRLKRWEVSSDRLMLHGYP